MFYSFSLFNNFFTAKPLGSGAFGQVFLAQATGIVAFDPRGSTKRKPGRRRSRFGSTSRPYYNDKRVTAVAVKSLKGGSFCSSWLVSYVVIISANNCGFSYVTRQPSPKAFSLGPLSARSLVSVGDVTAYGSVQD